MTAPFVKHIVNKTRQDFRSENGLYQLIQAEYDHAMKPTSTQDEDEQYGERPSKRRKLNRTNSEPMKSIEGPAAPRRILRASRSMGFPSTEDGSESDLSSVDEAPMPSTVSLDTVPSSQNSLFAKGSFPNIKGKNLFDAVIWQDKISTQTFYRFTTNLRFKVKNEVKETSEVHKFIRTLRDGGRLVRNYTQNIDLLEEREGLCGQLRRGVGNRGRFNPKLRKDPRAGNDHEGGSLDAGVEVVYLHGSLEKLRCTLCHKVSSWDEKDRAAITYEGLAPLCPHCESHSAAREEKGRRGVAVGGLRPDIVLYGEEHPAMEHIGTLTTHDISLQPDMMVIMGTSLRVHGLKNIVRQFSNAVHHRGGIVVFVNNTKPADSTWGEFLDYWVESDCDAWVNDVKSRREDIWTPQGALSREGSPQPGKEKSNAPPKNPQSMRPHYKNGAYQMDKIKCNLRRLCGTELSKEELELRQRAESRMIPFQDKPQKTKAVAASQAAASIKLAPQTTAARTPASSKPVRSHQPAARAIAYPYVQGSGWRKRGSPLLNQDLSVYRAHCAAVTLGRSGAATASPSSVEPMINANGKRPRPQAVRPCTKNGAYFHHKVHEQLQTICGPRPKPATDESATGDAMDIDTPASTPKIASSPYDRSRSQTPIIPPQSPFAISTSVLPGLVPRPGKTGSKLSNEIRLPSPPSSDDNSSGTPPARAASNASNDYYSSKAHLNSCIIPIMPASPRLTPHHYPFLPPRQLRDGQFIAPLTPQQHSERMKRLGSISAILGNSPGSPSMPQNMRMLPIPVQTPLPKGKMPMTTAESMMVPKPEVFEQPEASQPQAFSSPLLPGARAPLAPRQRQSRFGRTYTVYEDRMGLRNPNGQWCV